MRFRLKGGCQIIWLVAILGALAQCAPLQPMPPRFKSLAFYNDITFQADFDNGNLESVVALDAHEFLIKPRPDKGKDDLLSRLYLGSLKTPWNGRTAWYHFTVSVSKSLLPYPLRLRIDHSREWTSGVYAVYAQDKVPVTSCDGTVWRYVGGWSRQAGSSLITEMLTCPRAHFALATPYSWSQIEHEVRRLETARYVQAHAIIARTPVGSNQESLPLYYLLITDEGPPQAKRNIVVVSGQHPGEVVNTWMVKGLIQFLLSEAAMAHMLRHHFAFHIYPAVNPEGVKYGHFRRSADSRLNPNRAWSSDEVLEIKAIREHLLAQTGGTVDYFFDLHGSMRQQHFIFYFVDQPGAAAFVDAVNRRHASVHDHRQGGLKRRFAWYDAVASRWAMKHLRTSRNPAAPPLSFTPEGAYAQGSWEGSPEQTREMMAVGAALVKAIYDVDPYLPRP